MMNTKKIDLHIHSYFSDGENSPEVIQDLVAQSGINIFSITDHNYIAPNVDQFIKQLPKELKFIQGVEISSVDRMTGQSLHILGYSSGFDITKLNQALTPVLEGYNMRAKNIIAGLNKRFGSSFDFTEMKRVIPAMYVSRNLLAAKLKEFIGGSMTMAEAVKKCFVPEDGSWILDAEKAVELIGDCGGVAVLAHPGNLLAKTNLAELVGRLVKVGMRGLEAYYPKHSKEITDVLLNIAENYNLTVTGGSDWHGQSYAKFPVGVDVPEAVYEKIKTDF